MENEIKVVDIKIPFWSLVKLVTKCMLASIPAALILWIVGVFFVSFVMTVAQM